MHGSFTFEGFSERNADPGAQLMAILHLRWLVTTQAPVWHRKRQNVLYILLRARRDRAVHGSPNLSEIDGGLSKEVEISCCRESDCWWLN
jgi:hypothetical protein